MALPAHAAIDIVKGDTTGLSLFGTGQVLGMGEYAPDDVKDNARAYLYLQQARLGFSGHLEDWRFATELALGGEDMTPGSVNPALTLLEMNFDVPLWGHAFLRAGQFKTPYGGEFLTPDGARLFNESSIANLGANFGREIGLALVAKSDFFNGALGVFTGGGEDTAALPIHALPETFGTPLIVLRAGIDNTGGDALTHTQAGVFKVDGKQEALYLQAAYELDSMIGHSSAMNIKAGQANEVYQQNLLLNAAWNPFLTTSSQASLYGLDLNGMLRTSLGDTVLTGEVEAGGTGFTDSAGSLLLATARLQGSAARKPWEFALRIAALMPDSKMGPKGYSGLIGGSPFYEITPSVSYSLRDWSKVILEFQGMVNVPVAHEPGDGAYVLSDMPSQTTYSGGADTITREFIPEVKLMWQIAL